MQALVGISFTLLIGVSLVVGTRLLLLARRTGELPERALGANLVIVMGIAYPGMILMELDLGWPLAVERTVMVGLNAVLNAGFLLFFVFTARVFRPGVRWAQWVVAVAAALFVVHVGLVAHTLFTVLDPVEARIAVTPTGLISLGTALVGFAWSSFEAFSHWDRLRRRERLGLVDPVVCDRIWLWAMMATASLAGACANWVYLMLGIDVLVTPSAMLITALTGLLQGIFLWLTFMPPAIYLAHVRRRVSAEA